MARTRINKAVASSSDYQVERTVEDIRREMREIKNDILYNNRISHEMYERRMFSKDGSANLTSKQPKREYTEHRCFGKTIKIYV